jgi:hypothetical protein
VISAHATPLQHTEESAADRQLQAWRSGLAILDLPASTANPNAGFAELTAALPNLLSVGPLLKRQIWQMLQAAIYADSEVTSAEQLLLQAFALLLEIPAVKEQTNSAT